MNFEPTAMGKFIKDLLRGGMCAYCKYGDDLALRCYGEGWDKCKGQDFEPKEVDPYADV